MVVKLGVLASWRGTNFKAIVDHARLGVLKNIEVVLLIYTDEKAPVVDIAREYGIPAIYVKHKGIPREEREAQLIDLLRLYNIDLVILAGYDYILSSLFIDKYKWRILNIHPSLLPYAGGKGMYGARVHMEVFKSGVKITGATVHFVDTSVDGGPILDQCPVYIGDIYALNASPREKIELISDRVLVFEHRLYSRAIQLVADNLVELVEIESPVVQPIEEGGRIKYVENSVKSIKAVVKADEKWFEEWRNRQRAYVDLQIEEWRKMGKPLDKILGPWSYC